MHVIRLYYKWDAKIEVHHKYKLNQKINEDILNQEFEKTEENNWLKLKSNPSFGIKINNEGNIISISLSRGCKIGNIEINQNFISEIKKELDQYLEICEKEYSGDKLLLNFGDALLGLAIITKGDR